MSWVSDLLGIHMGQGSGGNILGGMGGAALGTLFAPGIGTAIGAGLGAGGGGMLGGQNFKTALPVGVLAGVGGYYASPYIAEAMGGAGASELAFPGVSGGAVDAGYYDVGNPGYATGATWGAKGNPGYGMGSSGGFKDVFTKMGKANQIMRMFGGNQQQAQPTSAPASPRTTYTGVEPMKQNPFYDEPKRHLRLEYRAFGGPLDLDPETMTMVGENGPELVMNTPQGPFVVPNPSDAFTVRNDLVPPPSTGGIVPEGSPVNAEAPQTGGLYDYWKKPIVGNMPRDQFVQTMGLLASSLDPNGVGGRIGKGLYAMGGQANQDRMHYEAKQQFAQEQRAFLEKKYQEQAKDRRFGQFVEFANKAKNPVLRKIAYDKMSDQWEKDFGMKLPPWSEDQTPDVMKQLKEFRESADQLELTPDQRKRGEAEILFGADELKGKDYLDAVYGKPDTKETWSEPYVANVGGKKALVQQSSHGKIAPVIQDKSTTVVMSPEKPPKPPTQAERKSFKDMVDKAIKRSGGPTVNDVLQINEAGQRFGFVLTQKPDTPGKWEIINPFGDNINVGGKKGEWELQPIGGTAPTAPAKSAPSTGGSSKRDTAIQTLKAAGKPVTEANIKYVMGQM